MEVNNESINNSQGENLIPQNSRSTVSNKICRFFGLPKSIREHFIDTNQNTWPSNTLLCATVFLEDAINYQSIVHKVTRNYLVLYRWFSSSLIKKFHQFVIMINLCLIFCEYPSSLSVTSDVRYNPQRIEFSSTLLMAIEGITLCWFLIYISVKIAWLSLRLTRNRLWILICIFVTIYSLCEWGITLIFFSHIQQGLRLRRIFRPIFLIESSQLMKKTIRALLKNALKIIACITLVLIHILLFATIAMFLYPQSKTDLDSQGNTYFPSLHDSAFNLLVLYSTANNPDVMMPAYSENRLNALFFIIFIIIGIYCIQNITTAVVYRAFRGYFLNSIINAQLRRRIAVRASFEVLRKCLTYEGFMTVKDSIPISLVQEILKLSSMNQWHFDRINEKLVELSSENETINLDQYDKTMQLLDLNPRLSPAVNLPPISNNLIGRLRVIFRSKAFDAIGTVFALTSVIFVTIEIAIRRTKIDTEGNVPFTLSIALTNLGFMIFFILEIILKAWAYGPMNFFRMSAAHLLEALVASTCFILQISYMILRRTAIVTLTELDIEAINKSYFSLWSAIKICNMCFIYRLIRFLPASKNIRIIVGTVVDLIRNGGAFFGFLFSCYYAYSIFGMEIFGGAVGELYKNFSQSTAICGTYEQLSYWPNNFDDFFASMITLYNIMIVNQWFAFVIGFRTATQSRWSEIYFIFWYLFVTTIGLNICLALNSDIHDAKKTRAEQEQQELIVSNMFDIYRSEIKQPTTEEITQRLYDNPYIKFNDYQSEQTTHI